MAYKKDNLYQSTVKAVKGFWGNVVSKWKYGSYTKEKPAGFLTRSFHKAVIAGTALSVFSLGFALLCGNWAERTYRNIGGDPHRLSLTLDTDKDANTAAPLYVGSAEVKRIITMQEDLLTLGYPLSACGANGEFQKQDLRAVNWFQAAVGLPQSEFVDGRTLRNLAAQAANRRSLTSEFGEESTSQPVLVKSFVNPSLSEKARIREVQADLFQLGYPIGACKINGIMNDDVVAAVVKFQEKQPRMLANGEVDYKTYTALESAAYQSLVASGLLDNAKAQGLDDMSAIVYGQQMSPEELHKLAVKYVKNGAPEYVVQGVLEATQTAGFDFVYLMDVALHESGYKPWVGAGTSSAYGNFQFTNDTWLGAFKSYGSKYGYGKLVNDLNSGHIAPEEKNYIMGLRNDPKIAALMTIELSKANLAFLQSNLGGAVSKTDLYMSWFLGPGGALKFIQEFRRDNNQDAAKIFPKEAAANPAIFYENGKPDGKHQSLGAIYSRFSKTMTGGQVLRVTTAQGPKKLAAAAPSKTLTPA